MVKNIAVRKLRSNLAHILKDVKTKMDRYVISRHGEPEAVLMCVDDYEGWLETIDVLSDKKLCNKIKKAGMELRKGDVRALSKIEKELGIV